MSGEVVVALITLLGSAIGTIGGIFATNKMTAYRIEQLEKKVDKHNQVVERMYEAEKNISVETKEQFDQAPFMKIILRDARFSIEGAYDTLQEALELALSPGGPYFYEKTLRKDLEIITKIKEAQTFSELCESFVKMEKPRVLNRVSI